MELLKRFWREEEALTAVEYGLMLGLLALLAVAAMVTLFSNVGGVFQKWATWFGTAGQGTIPTGS